jgi:DNA-binding NarL/FixJ family response regulator
MLGSADFVRLTNFGSGTHVLVILDDDNPEASAKMLRLGCRGVLPERPSAKVLRQAVLALIQGELWAPRRLISALYSELLRMAFDKGQNALTPQEQRILELSAEGHKNSAIAITLSISPETVRWHKRRLYRKIGRGGLPRFPQAVDVIRPITAAG